MTEITEPKRKDSEGSIGGNAKAAPASPRRSRIIPSIYGREEPPSKREGRRDERSGDKKMPARGPSVPGAEPTVRGDGLRRLTRETPFAVIDLETTGFAPPSHRITEVAVVLVDGFEIGESFSTLVNPERAIPAEITELTGINNKMVKSAPKTDKVLADLIEFVGDRVFVCHNAQFDTKFLKFEMERVLDRDFTNLVLCTCRLARRIYPFLSNKGLDTVAQFLDINIEGRHRAFGDAYATARILISFLEMLERRGMKSLSSVLRFQEERKKILSRLP